MNQITTVNAIIINKEKELLVVRKNNSFLLPGGKIEPNESDFDALARELFEETNLQLIDAKQFKNYNFNKALNEDAPLQMRIYITRVKGNPSPNNEISEILWLNKLKYKTSSNFPKSFWDIIFNDLKKANIMTFDGY